MPLSEFYQATLREKIDATPSKMLNCSSNLSFVPDDDFVELLWENGHVVIQGQCNRPGKTAVENVTFSSLDDRAEEKRSASVTETKMAQLEDRSLFVSDFSPTDPSSNSRTSDQYDDMVPWINYPMEDPSPSDYCSDFFSEFPGVVMPAQGNNNLEHSIKDLPYVEHGIVSKALRDESNPCTIRTKHSQDYQSSLQSSRKRTEDSDIGGGCNNAQDVPGNMLGTRLQKHDLETAKPQQAENSVESVNFSHFSKPSAIAKVNLQRVDRVRNMEDSTIAATSSNNRIQSTATESLDAMQSTSRHQGQFCSVPIGSAAEKSHHLLSTELSQSVYEEGKPRKNLRDDIAGISEISLRSLDQVSHQTSDLATGISLRALGIERDHEAIVASSSTCSDNITGVTSDDPKRDAKRKYQEKEPGNHIEDIEDAFVGVKRPTVARDTSAKRSRAAEVHNLSERRRRDRINEKMRALQELIPNSSKVDKASMLDEAIEYLKSLQLQVQMMSMGSGLSMPPMVLQNGMQHMRVPPVAHLPQMGMGMNMRFGYGIGMLDMNGSPGYPLIPIPMHSAHFPPRPTVPGPQGLYTMPRSANVPTFGLPTPGNLNLPPPFNFMPDLSTNSNSTTSTSSLQAPGAAPSSNYKDRKERRPSLEPSQETDDNDLQGTKESPQQCESKQTSSASENETEN